MNVQVYSGDRGGHLDCLMRRVCAACLELRLCACNDACVCVFFFFCVSLQAEQQEAMLDELYEESLRMVENNNKLSMKVVKQVKP